MSLQTLLEQGVTVLTASRRLAHALRLDFAFQAQAQGKRVWLTPRVLPWSAWLRQQHLESRSVSQGPLQTRVLKPAQARVLWDRVVADSRAAADLLNPSNAARLAARSWRLMHDYLIPLERLQAFDAPEAQTLLTWCNEFSRRCAALGAIDEAKLAFWAFDSGLVPAERLALAGFDTLPPAMRRLVERWREAGRIVAADPQPVRQSSVTVVEATDRDGEIELVAQWAREQVTAGASNIGVIVPDLQNRREEVRRVFDDVLASGTRRTHSAAAALPVVVAAPNPLSSYPLVDAALLVLQLVSGESSSPQAGRLLRSPFIKGGDAERGPRALADLRLREEQRDRWDWLRIERWAAMTECEQLLLAARDLNVIIRSLPTSAMASEWAERFHAILRSIGWPGDRTLTSAEFQTLEKFQEGLAEFGALDAIAGRMGLRHALGRLQDLLGDTPFEPETVSAAITVIDTTTSAGMQFDALWVVGLDADRWPPAANPDALIPLELQRTAGIPEASAQGSLTEAMAQLQRWKSSAPQVVLSWPGRDGDVELNRSPLLAGIPVSVMSFGRAVALRQLLFDSRPTLESLRDDRMPKLPVQAAKGGARTLELQSRCPFRAQAELRLRARELPRVGIGVEAVDRGAILHKVLAEVWGELRDQARLLALDDAALATLVRESAERQTMQALLPDTPSRNRLAALEIESVIRQVLTLLRIEKTRPAFSVSL
ncbi:MAG TPA: PD-(D/E)XK nuclease family protein, partial [Povalibacter sp.]|nr:PD-(D/E)XK nuclease family protein [Povalibacter sp.]